MGGKQFRQCVWFLRFIPLKRHMYRSAYEACDLSRQLPPSGCGSLVPLLWWASGCSLGFKHQADARFHHRADATHECFEMGLIAAHVTARNLTWIGRGKGTKKHQATNQRGKKVQRKTRQQVGIKLKQSETQRLKVRRRWKHISSSYSRVVAIFYFLCFSISQLVCSKHGLVYDEKKTNH